VLDGVDLHNENLIAAGEHPMLIDLETLFHQELFAGPAPEDASARALGRLRLSVIRTLFLPRRTWREGDGVGVNISGLGNGETQVTPAVGVWADRRADTMHQAQEPRELLPGPNLPRVGGDVAPVTEHTEALVAGFEATLRFLASARDALLAEGGSLMAFAGDKVRRVLRSTPTYGKLLIVCKHPDYLRDLLDREQVLDHLWSASWETPPLWRVVPAEKEDLRLGDIPYFTTRPDSLDLEDSRGDVLKDFFPMTAMSSVKARLLALDELEIASQVFMIRASLSATPTSKPLAPVVSSMTTAYEAEVRGLPRSTFDADGAGIGVALAIGERLLDSAILGARDATWLGTTAVGGDELAFQVDPVGADLYTGTGGIALFLAHLGHVTKEERFIRLAERAAHTTRAAIEKDASRPSGGFLGVVAHLYVLAHLSALWGDPTGAASLEAAPRASHGLHPARRHRRHHVRRLRSHPGAPRSLRGDRRRTDAGDGGGMWATSRGSRGPRRRGRLMDGQGLQAFPAWLLTRCWRLCLRAFAPRARAVAARPASRGCPRLRDPRRGSVALRARALRCRRRQLARLPSG